MATSDTDQQQTPYDVTPRVWRDEQPGDDPRLIVSVTFALRASSERWRDVRLQALEVRADERRWTPSESSIEPFGTGGFEVKGFGAPTLPAGVKVIIVVGLETSAGERRLELSAEIQRVS